MLRFALACCLTLITACGSIPLGTIAKLSQFNRERALEVRPEDVALRVSVPRGLKIDPAKTYIVIHLEQTGDAAPREFKLALRQFHHGPGMRAGGLLRDDVPTTDFELVLTDEGRRTLAELQQILSNWRGGRMDLSAGTNFGTEPAQMKFVTLWMDLRLFRLEGYFPLIDGARLTVKHTQG